MDVLLADPPEEYLEEMNKCEFENPFLKGVALDCGATACIVMMTKDKIYCANAGDTRCVLYVNDKIMVMSKDHKPNDKDEEARINKAGSKVI